MHCHLVKTVQTLASAIVAVALVFAAPARAQPTDVADEINAVLDELEQTEDFEKSRRKLQDLFDRVVFGSSVDDHDSFRHAAHALRLVNQLDAADVEGRIELLRFLRSNDELAATMVFLVNEQRDNVPGAYALLEQLRRRYGDKLNDLSPLAAAVCVVHDTPLRRQINENRAIAPDPLAVFDYFRANERNMLLGLRDVPAPLLIFVVDTTSSIEEMQWALQRYAGDEVVGARFFDIEYDWDHFRLGRPKQVTVAGWNLPNILRLGGICADQAYFAMSVGKAIGVPTTYTVGRSAGYGHAWVGFLQRSRTRAWWNFDIGRYEEYQGVRGVVSDPQTRQFVPDSFVSLRARLSATSRKERHAALALIDAAMRLRELSAPPEQTDIFLDHSRDHIDELQADRVRAVDVDSILELLEQGLRLSPGSATGWLLVRDLAHADQLSLTQKREWAGVLHRLCGSDHPDFYLEILRPMIESIDDIDDQNALWNKAFGLFKQRSDLAAEVRMAQATMWAKAGDDANAGKCYEDVIARFANAGPFVLAALFEAEQLLLQAGQDRKVLMLYDRAFKTIEPPEQLSSPFRRQSNWYKVGRLYADRLDAAGFAERAASLRQNLGG